MKKNARLIFALAFMVLAIAITLTIRPVTFFFPTQEVDLSRNADFGQVLPGNLFTQQIILKKNYLESVEVYLGKVNEGGISNNLVVISDERNRVLLSKRFSSEEIIKADYYPFAMNIPVKVGAGGKIYVSISSLDGDPSSALALPLNKTSKFGTFRVARIQDNDIMATIANPKESAPIDGSIGIRTHETNNALFNLPTFFMIILYLLTGLVIIFWTRIRPLLLRFRLRPEYAFAIIAIPFGLAFLYLTPPFQTPDEPAHFYRAYEISELNLSRMPDEVPVSVRTIAMAGERMKFKSWEKISRAEIRDLKKIKLEPEKRMYVESVNYTLPYLPQALGIALARTVSDSPVDYLYWARLFNLFTAIILIFLAIRTTPLHKWVFFLLGVMPMTVSQMASVSYDAPTIGLSFLLFAKILDFGFGAREKIPKKGILLIFLLTVLLAFTKPPYFLIAVAFLLIPAARIGTLKKYAVIFTGLLLAGILISQFPGALSSIAQAVFVRKANAATLTPLSLQAAYAELQTGQFPEDTLETTGTVEMKTPDTNNQSTQPPDTLTPPPLPPSPYDASAQIKFILDNPFRYAGILVNSVIRYAGLYMTSFVGLFGWNDTGLPDPMVSFYLIVILLVAATDINKGVKMGWRQKAILISVFLVCLVIIETGLYLYSNLVGTNFIVGVQGRYFIPLAPLVFLLFYQRKLASLLTLNKKGDEQKHRKSKETRKAAVSEATTPALTPIQYLPWLLVPVALFALVYSLIFVLNRFYIILV
jgi:uncharacterized membrane protein